LKTCDIFSISLSIDLLYFLGGSDPTEPGHGRSVVAALLEIPFAPDEIDRSIDHGGRRKQWQCVASAGSEVDARHCLPPVVRSCVHARPPTQNAVGRYTRGRDPTAHFLVLQHGLAPSPSFSLAPKRTGELLHACICRSSSGLTGNF
jgi:hypothetical protein